MSIFFLANFVTSLLYTTGIEFCFIFATDNQLFRI